MKESDARGKYYEKIGLTFQFTLTKQHVVDANRFGSIMKFVNNGVQEASNNIRPIIMTVNGERKICFYAIKNIEINDELFFDYQWDKKTQDKFFKVKTGNK
jgi:SET domain-containing protein